MTSVTDKNIYLSTVFVTRQLFPLSFVYTFDILSCGVEVHDFSTFWR